jgi:DNA transposition AAA+ family ATPase
MRSAHLEGEVAVVYGQAGLGKTMALKQYCADNPDAVLIEADPSFTAQVLLRHIARAIGANPTGTLHELFEAVVERLQDSGRLIGGG